MNCSDHRKAVKPRQKGHAVLEISLMAPWLLFLFCGSFDMGFYHHALTSTANAAQVAASYTSSSTTAAADASGACTYVLAELNSMRNVRGLASCNSYPVIVSATAVTGVDGSPASSVSVTYQTDQLIPIPGLLMGRLTVTRTVQMRINQ